MPPYNSKFDDHGDADRKDWMGTDVYRFVGSGTSTKNTQLSMTRMATKTDADKNGLMCNTRIVGYIDSDVQPTVEVGGTITASGAYDKSNRSFKIKITNCGPFFIYHLADHPFTCIRYCGA